MTRRNYYRILPWLVLPTLLSGCLPGLMPVLPDLGGAAPPPTAPPVSSTITVTVTVNGDQMTSDQSSAPVESARPPASSSHAPVVGAQEAASIGPPDHKADDQLMLRLPEADETLPPVEDDPCSDCKSVKLLGPLWNGMTAEEHNRVICSGAPEDQIDVGGYAGCSDYLK